MDEEELEYIKYKSYHKGLGIVIYLDRDFKMFAPTSYSKCLSEAEENGRAITASELASIYIKELTEKRFKKDGVGYTVINQTYQSQFSYGGGSWVNEGSLVIPKLNKRYLVRPSLILQNPELAYSYHADEIECPVHLSEHEDQIIDILATDKASAKILLKYFIPPIDENEYEYLKIDNLNPIPTNRFGEDEKTSWLFGEHAEDYGLLLKDQFSMDDFSLNFSSFNENSDGKPFAGQLYFLPEINMIHCNLSFFGNKHTGSCIVISKPSKEEIDKILAVQKKRGRTAGVISAERILYLDHTLIESKDNFGYGLLNINKKNKTPVIRNKRAHRFL